MRPAADPDRRAPPEDSAAPRSGRLADWCGVWRRIWSNAPGGWRGLALSALFGAAAAAALPPLHLLIGLAGFTGLWWRLRAAPSAGAAFAAGWAFAFGYHLAGLYWVANALLVDSARHGWLVPFAAAGLPAGLGLFGGAAALLAWRLARPLADRPAAGLVALAVCWTGAEWLRGLLFTGFPWNLPAYAWAGSAPMMQPAAWIGPYGLSLFTVALGLAPALLLDGVRGRARRAAMVAGLAAAVALVWAAGSWRLSLPSPGMVPAVVVRVVQGNVAQKEKWLPALRQRHLRHHLALSALPAPMAAAAGLAPGAAVSHLVWPEAALPVALRAGSPLFEILGEAAPAGGVLLTGAIRFDGNGDDGSGDEAPRYFNSILAVRPGGAVAAVYDKVHLVPFGEYVPLADWLPLRAIAGGLGEFAAGSARPVLDLPGLVGLSPLICYEAIFPGAVVARRPDGSRASAMLNVTNDGWFGASAGPWQHFAMARFRAVEEGVPLIRAANTGISAIVDARGRILVSLGVGETGVIDSPLPRPLPAATLYARTGDLPTLLVLASALAFAAAWRRRGGGKGEAAR